MAATLEEIRKAEEWYEEWKLWQRLNLKAPLPQFVKPWPTMQLLERIHDNSETAMAFANNVAKAFEQTGIKLEDDETFACMLCVVKKPKYVSEVTGLAPEPFVAGPTPEPSVAGPTPEPSVQDPTPEPSQISRGMVWKMAYAGPAEDGFPFTELHAKAWRSIRYNVVMDPTIMKAVMKRKEDERILY